MKTILKNNEDQTCLAEGYVFPTAFEKTGINGNELIIGGTRSGKTTSNALSRILHTNNSSIIACLAKKDLLTHNIEKNFIKKGYDVKILDFTNPKESEIGYDPLDYVKTEEDIVNFSNEIVSPASGSNSDPYWKVISSDMLSAVISLSKKYDEIDGLPPSMKNVIYRFNDITVKNGDGGLVKTSYDYNFEDLEESFPGNFASRKWKTVQGLATRTFSCVYSIANNAVSSLNSEGIIEILNKSKRVNFSELGKKKTALFIITSHTDKSFEGLLNLFYADLFRTLHQDAQKNENGRLNVPVHIICDDFAATGKINNFEKLISVFCASGISVSLLLQSETQLSIYADYNTIISNCDTYVYYGSWGDMRTSENIARRLNKPIKEVLELPLESAIVFRRGSKAFIGKRYKTFEDPLYKELFDNEELNEK